jgi:Tol biopolymer transport system component
MTVAIAPDGNRAVFSTQRVSVRLWQFPFDKTGTGLAQGLALTDGSADVLSSNVARDAEAVVFNLKRLGAAEPVSLWAMDLESRRSQPLGTNALFPTWSPDHQQVAYQKAATDEKTGAWMTAVAIQRLGGREHFVTPWVTGKSISPGDWSRDGTAVVVCSERLETWAVADAPGAAPSRILMQVPNATLWQARFSPNGRWLTFVAVRDSGVADVGVTTADGSPDREWMRVATDHQWVDKPRWAADGRRLYFLANRGSYLNLWAVDFDPQGGFPVGKPFAVTHFDSPSFRISPAVASSDIDISSRHAFLTLHTVTGNVWMLDNVDR